MVTLTGAGGAGKTRLAIETAGRLTEEFDDGVWWIDLAPVADPIVVPVTIARTLGLPDQQGRSPMETVLRFISDRKVLLVFDNCEHLLDMSGETIIGTSQRVSAAHYPGNQQREPFRLPERSPGGCRHFR